MNSNGLVYLTRGLYHLVTREIASDQQPQQAKLRPKAKHDVLLSITLVDFHRGNLPT
jgi:hypothetical protein